MWSNFLDVLVAVDSYAANMLWLAQFFSSVLPLYSAAEWLACWTQAQKGPGSNRSRDAVG